MLISKINLSTAYPKSNNVRPNFKGILSYVGREESSSSGMGWTESYYDRYNYIPNYGETKEMMAQSLKRLVAKAVKRLPDDIGMESRNACSYKVLIDYPELQDGTPAGHIYFSKSDFNSSNKTEN